MSTPATNAIVAPLTSMLYKVVGVETGLDLFEAVREWDRTEEKGEAQCICGRQEAGCVLVRHRASGRTASVGTHCIEHFGRTEEEYKKMRTNAGVCSQCHLLAQTSSALYSPNKAHFACRECYMALEHRLKNEFGQHAHFATDMNDNGTLTGRRLR